MALTEVEAIKFVVVISGGKLGGSKVPAPTLAKNAFSSPIEIPSLHCFGTLFSVSMFTNNHAHRKYILCFVF